MIQPSGDMNNVKDSGKLLQGDRKGNGSCFLSFFNEYVKGLSHLFMRYGVKILQISELSEVFSRNILPPLIRNYCTVMNEK